MKKLRKQLKAKAKEQFNFGKELFNLAKKHPLWAFGFFLWLLWGLSLTFHHLGDLEYTIQILKQLIS